MNMSLMNRNANELKASNYDGDVPKSYLIKMSFMHVRGLLAELKHRYPMLIEQFNEWSEMSVNADPFTGYNQGLTVLDNIEAQIKKLKKKNPSEKPDNQLLDLQQTCTDILVKFSKVMPVTVSSPRLKDIVALNYQLANRNRPAAQTLEEKLLHLSSDLSHRFDQKQFDEVLKLTDYKPGVLLSHPERDFIPLLKAFIAEIEEHIPFVSGTFDSRTLSDKAFEVNQKIIGLLADTPREYLRKMLGDRFVISELSTRVYCLLDCYKTQIDEWKIAIEHSKKKIKHGKMAEQALNQLLAFIANTCGVRNSYPCFPLGKLANELEPLPNCLYLRLTDNKAALMYRVSDVAGVHTITRDQLAKVLGIKKTNKVFAVLAEKNPEMYKLIGEYGEAINDILRERHHLPARFMLDAETKKFLADNLASVDDLEKFYSAVYDKLGELEKSFISKKSNKATKAKEKRASNEAKEAEKPAADVELDQIAEREAKDAAKHQADLEEKLQAKAAKNSASEEDVAEEDKELPDDKIKQAQEARTDQAQEAKADQAPKQIRVFDTQVGKKFLQAEELRKAGKYVEALKLYKETFKLAEEERNYFLATDCLHKQTVCYSKHAGQVLDGLTQKVYVLSLLESREVEEKMAAYKDAYNQAALTAADTLKYARAHIEQNSQAKFVNNTARMTTQIEKLRLEGEALRKDARAYAELYSRVYEQRIEDLKDSRRRRMAWDRNWKNRETPHNRERDLLNEMILKKRSCDNFIAVTDDIAEHEKVFSREHAKLHEGVILDPLTLTPATPADEKAFNDNLKAAGNAVKASGDTLESSTGFIMKATSVAAQAASADAKQNTEGKRILKRPDSTSATGVATTPAASADPNNNTESKRILKRPDSTSATDLFATMSLMPNEHAVKKSTVKTYAAATVSLERPRAR